MKHKILVFTACLLLGGMVLAQKRDIEGSRSMEGGKMITDINIKKDIYSRVKLMKKNKDFGLIKGAIHFKTIDVGAALLGKGQGRTTVTSYAILEGLTDDDFNEIAEKFNESFMRKLGSLGLSEIDWSEIESAKKYPKLLEKQQDKDEVSKSVGAYKVVTVGDRPHFKMPVGNLTVFNQMKAISKSIDGPVLTYDVIVDFARFDIDASRWRTDGYGPGYDFQTTETSANILPQIGIEHVLNLTLGPPPVVYQSCLFYLDDAGRYDQVQLNKSIYVRENYANDIDSFKGQMPKSMKRMITINTSNTGTFVVKADPEKYKRIALEALEAYADNMIKAIEAEL